MSTELLTAQFQDQEIADVLVEYDGPRIYSFYTPSNKGYYLAYNVEQTDQLSGWIYVSINSFRLYSLLSKEISIRDFILKSEACYEVTVSPNNQIEQLAIGCDQTKLPAAGVMLKADYDFLSFSLSGPKISPFSISESDFTNILTTICSGTIKAMKTLKSFLPGKYQDPSKQIFGTPLCAPGSLKMLVKVASDRDLLRDTLQISSHKESAALEAQYGLQATQIAEIKNNFYSIAPPLRARGSVVYDTVTIGSSLLNANDGAIVLSQDHKRKYLDFTKSSQSTDDLIIIQGKVIRAARDRCSFTIHDAQSNLANPIDVECMIDPEDEDLINNLTTLDDKLRDCETPQDLVSMILTLGLKLKVSGVSKASNSLQLAIARLIE
ncbi:DUF6575 domain-containing protein [Bdellovibrionota bacterium FG-2]